MRFDWKTRGGSHYAKGRRYEYPEIVTSSLRLDLLFPQKFVLVGEYFKIPRPMSLGQTEPLQREVRDMGIFIQSRQHFLPVPRNDEAAKQITRQELMILEDGEPLLQGESAFNLDSGEEDAPDLLPTFWAKVGSTIVQQLVYKSEDGRVSYPYETTYIQEDPWPEPVPEPIPVPDVPPGPTPEPVPVELPVPSGLGLTEPLAKVDSESRPVQRR